MGLDGAKTSHPELLPVCSSFFFSFFFTGSVLVSHSLCPHPSFSHPFLYPCFLGCNHPFCWCVLRYAVWFIVWGGRFCDFSWLCMVLWGIVGRRRLESWGDLGGWLDEGMLIWDGEWSWVGERRQWETQRFFSLPLCSPTRLYSPTRACVFSPIQLLWCLWLFSIFWFIFPFGNCTWSGGLLCLLFYILVCMVCLKPHLRLFAPPWKSSHFF